MTLSTETQLATLSHGELLALVKELIGAAHQLQARVAELEADRAQPRPPLATSHNSSQPPARDQKANLPGRRRKRVGVQPGHECAIRGLVDAPDQVNAGWIDYLPIDR